jgi:anti-anti-sigma factor
MLSDRGVTITLEGEIDISREIELERTLRPAEWADRATLDFSNVSFASTTLINAIVRLHNHIRQHGRTGTIRIIGCAPHVKRVLKLAHLDSIFEIL